MKLEGSVITIPRLNEYRDIIRKSKAAAKEYQYLYHCTSIEGLKGMLNSNSFWLSNLQCVNDKEEANRIGLPEYEKEYYVGCFTYEDNVPRSHWLEYGNLSDGVLFSVKRDWFNFAESRFLDDSNNIVEMIKFTEKREALKHIIGSYIYIDRVDFYKIIYDNDLILDMKTEASIQNGDEEKIQLLKDERERISQQLPPGIGDSGKKNNSNGDIIIWNEIKKCIKDKGNAQYLFITNDEKKNSNWFGKNLEGLHPLLQEEIYKIFRYDALDITTLYGFILFCKPYVDEDLDKLCEYLVNHNNFIRLEVEEYFNDEGQEILIEGIGDYIRSNYMGDWAIPYDSDIEIELIEYVTDLTNEEIIVLLEFGVSGNAEACYHCDSEDNFFDSEYEAFGRATVYIPIQIGKYTEMFSLKYNDMKVCVKDIDVETTDPLNEEVEDGCDYDEIECYEEEEWFDE